MNGYAKGNYVIVPNTEVLAGKRPIVQTLFMWLCIRADAMGELRVNRDQLAADCGTTATTISHALKELRDIEVIEQSEDDPTYYCLMVLEGED